MGAGGERWFLVEIAINREEFLFTRKTDRERERGERWKDKGQREREVR